MFFTVLLIRVDYLLKKFEVKPCKCSNAGCILSSIDKIELQHLYGSHFLKSRHLNLQWSKKLSIMKKHFNVEPGKGRNYNYNLKINGTSLKTCRSTVQQIFSIPDDVLNHVENSLNRPNSKRHPETLVKKQNSTKIMKKNTLRAKQERKELRRMERAQKKLIPINKLSKPRTVTILQRKDQIEAESYCKAEISALQYTEIMEGFESQTKLRLRFPINYQKTVFLKFSLNPEDPGKFKMSALLDKAESENPPKESNVQILEQVKVTTLMNLQEQSTMLASSNNLTDSDIQIIKESVGRPKLKQLKKSVKRTHTGGVIEINFRKILDKSQLMSSLIESQSVLDTVSPVEMEVNQNTKADIPDNNIPPVLSQSIIPSMSNNDSNISTTPLPFRSDMEDMENIEEPEKPQDTKPFPPPNQMETEGYGSDIEIVAEFIGLKKKKQAQYIPKRKNGRLICYPKPVKFSKELTALLRKNPNTIEWTKELTNTSDTSTKSVKPTESKSVGNVCATCKEKTENIKNNPCLCDMEWMQLVQDLERHQRRAAETIHENKKDLTRVDEENDLVVVSVELGEIIFSEMKQEQDPCLLLTSMNDIIKQKNLKELSLISGNAHPTNSITLWTSKNRNEFASCLWKYFSKYESLLPGKTRHLILWTEAGSDKNMILMIILILLVRKNKFTSVTHKMYFTGHSIFDTMTSPRSNSKERKKERKHFTEKISNCESHPYFPTIGREKDLTIINSRHNLLDFTKIFDVIGCPTSLNFSNISCLKYEKQYGGLIMTKENFLKSCNWEKHLLPNHTKEIFNEQTLIQWEWSLVDSF